LGRRFSAHPHRVPLRRATYNFGLVIGKNTRVDCYALEDGERTKRISSFVIDGSRVNHDFAASPRHLVFFFAPIYVSVWRMLMGRGMASTARYRTEKGTEIVIVPIDDPSTIVRFTVPAFFMEHTVNAFELPGGEIAVDFVHYGHLRDLEDFVGSVV